MTHSPDKCAHHITHSPDKCADHITHSPDKCADHTPTHLTNVPADRPPGKVEASESQVAIPAPHPPSTPEMTPAAVARAQVMDIAIGTTWGQ